MLGEGEDIRFNISILASCIGLNYPVVPRGYEVLLDEFRQCGSVFAVFQNLWWDGVEVGTFVCIGVCELVTVDVVREYSATVEEMLVFGSLVGLVEVSRYPGE